MTNCRNCDKPIDDYTECPWCVMAHMELLERLLDGDGAVTIATVSSWVMFKRSEQPERVWWVR